MGVLEAGDDLRRVYQCGLVEAHAEGCRCLDTLQNVHVVGQRGGSPLGAAQAVVPTGPGALAAWQQAGIGVQHHVVAGVIDGAEYGALLVAGAFQQRQGLIAVASEHHIVEAFGAGRAHEGHATFVAADAVNLAVEADALSKRSAQRRDIAARAAFDHPPLWALVDRQQAVVATEAHKELKREVEHVCARHRPDRRPHWHDVMIDEALPIAVRLKVVAQRGAGIDTLVVQVGQCLTVETQNVPDHPPEPWGHQVAALGEQGVQVVAVIFQARHRVMHGKTHLGRL